MSWVPYIMAAIAFVITMMLAKNVIVGLAIAAVVFMLAVGIVATDFEMKGWEDVRP